MILFVTAALAGSLAVPPTPPNIPAPAPPVEAVIQPSLDAPADVRGIPPGANITESGLAYRVLSWGDGGERPTPESRVTVHYTGWTTDGERFDSSYTRERPASFGLNAVIDGWTEGLQLMRRGAVYRLWIPEELAYKGRPGAPQGMLVFDVHLLDFETPFTPETPAHLDAPPAYANVTETGLAYVVLERGPGGAIPTPEDRVVTHYTGWTSDGKVLDSSHRRGKPATFPLRGVIAGWQEGLQLMQTGDSVRFWIPPELAYGGKPGRPQGLLIFDVQLIEIAD